MAFHNPCSRCAVEARSICTDGTGPQAAAANYLLALKAMVHMARVLGETDDAARYESELASGQLTFDRRYYNTSIGGYVGSRPPLEHQTLGVLARERPIHGYWPVCFGEHSAARLEMAGGASFGAEIPIEFDTPAVDTIA